MNHDLATSILTHMNKISSAIGLYSHGFFCIQCRL